MAQQGLPPSTEDIIGVSDEELLETSLSSLSGDDLTAAVYFLWQQWTGFSLHIINPTIERYHVPVIHQPEKINDDEYEFVYDIFDWGDVLATSKGVEGMAVGQSMCRLNYTIEKIIFLLVERLKSGGIDEETEVEVAFEGHLAAQRYAFASIINLEENVVVVNFDPDQWGEAYLESLSRISERGYGYPPSSPRSIYRMGHISGPSGPKS